MAATFCVVRYIIICVTGQADEDAPRTTGFVALVAANPDVVAPMKRRDVFFVFLVLV